MHALMISLLVALCKGTCSYQSHCVPHFKTLGVEQLVDLLHLGALLVLEGWEIIVIVLLLSGIILIDAETELDHAVDAASEGGGLVEGEAGGEEGGVEEEPDKVLDGLIVLVLLSTATQSVDDGVRGVDFHGLLGRHVARHGAVLESLCFHDALHIRGPAVLASHEAAWGGGQTVCDHNLLCLVAEHLLNELAEVLARGLLLLELLLLILGLLEVEALLGDSHQLLAIVLLELLHGVLIDGVC